MTRYRSSPTCSKCWTTGHTKRGCPDYRAKAEKWLAENPDAEEYHKPYWVQEVESYKNMGKNRKCSWCEQRGHNKRSCTARKGASTKNISKNKEWRAEVLEKLKEAGLGVGALLETKENNQRLYMIVDMKWDELNLTSSSADVASSGDYSKHHYKDGMNYPDMIISRVKNGGKTTTYYPQLLNKKGEELLYYGAERYDVVSPAEPSPPDGWVNDESWAKGLF